jgi:galactose mutarotase-like enzyme
MLHTIHNEFLTVSVNHHGAELWSIQDREGNEYLWQGDKTFWSDRSPNLFPYIGRMVGKKYSYKGISYPMEIHGIALYSDFELLEHSDTQMVFGLESSPESLAQYPWEFTFKVIYTLNATRLDIAFEVFNKSDSTMLFAVGGHPGFIIPAENFNNYRLRFGQPSAPERILFTPDCFVEDHTKSYDLVNGTDIPLRHDLFDEDAIVLKNTPKSVSLVGGSKTVTVSFPQMDYIGFWHQVGLPCPYVCIEPWSSLPSPKGEKTILDTQVDLLKLNANSTYQNTWSITIA